MEQLNEREKEFLEVIRRSAAYFATVPIDDAEATELFRITMRIVRQYKEHLKS